MTKGELLEIGQVYYLALSIERQSAELRVQALRLLGQQVDVVTLTPDQINVSRTVTDSEKRRELSNMQRAIAYKLNVLNLEMKEFCVYNDFVAHANS